MLKLLLYQKEHSGLHCTFGCATLKYSLGILKLLLYQKEHSGLHCTFGCATLKYSLGILQLLLYQNENSGLHHTFGCVTLKHSLGMLRLQRVQPRNNITIIIIISIIPKIKLKVTLHSCVCHLKEHKNLLIKDESLRILIKELNFKKHFPPTFQHISWKLYLKSHNISLNITLQPIIINKFQSFL